MPLSVPVANCAGAITAISLSCDYKKTAVNLASVFHPSSRQTIIYVIAGIYVIFAAAAVSGCRR
jgi:hypothetical protein